MPKKGYKQTEQHKHNIMLAQKGKRQSKEAIQKRINARKNNGKPWMSEGTKRKIGDANRGKHRTTEQKENLRKKNLGKKQSEITKLKKSIALIGKSYEELYGKKRAKELKELRRETRLRVMKNGPIKESNIEKKVENWLMLNNVPYVKQFRYKLGIADFWLPENNTIVEVDGKYWHSLPEVMERDKRQTKWLKQNGFTIIRIKEEDVNNGIISLDTTICGKI